MGSGKTTVGWQLAKRLGYNFIDLDRRVVELAGKSIRDVFEESGEAMFRELETHALKETLELDQIVVATGGATLCNQSSLDMVGSTAAVVYLQLSMASLVERLSGTPDRPLLLDKDGKMLPKELLRMRIRFLLNERVRFYVQASQIVDADGLSPQAVADVIAGQISEQA